MYKFLAERAHEELNEYEAKAKDAYRPADTYRAYGLALRYSTEELLLKFCPPHTLERPPTGSEPMIK